MLAPARTLPRTRRVLDSTNPAPSFPFYGRPEKGEDHAVRRIGPLVLDGGSQLHHEVAAHHEVRTTIGQRPPWVPDLGSRIGRFRQAWVSWRVSPQLQVFGVHKKAVDGSTGRR